MLLLKFKFVFIGFTFQSSRRLRPVQMFIRNVTDWDSRFWLYIYIHRKIKKIHRRLIQIKLYHLKWNSQDYIGQSSPQKLFCLAFDLTMVYQIYYRVKYRLLNLASRWLYWILVCDWLQTLSMKTIWTLK